ATACGRHRKRPPGRPRHHHLGRLGRARPSRAATHPQNELAFDPAREHEPDGRAGGCGGSHPTAARRRSL
ncbi:MAG: hypothetical protein AVDCRST_MAG50-1376, partial [uncultured Acidimicrobiales bacterium]